MIPTAAVKDGRARSPSPRRRPSSTATPPPHPGHSPGTQQSRDTLPADVRHYPEAIASAQRCVSSGQRTYWCAGATLTVLDESTITAIR